MEYFKGLSVTLEAKDGLQDNSNQVLVGSRYYMHPKHSPIRKWSNAIFQNVPNKALQALSGNMYKIGSPYTGKEAYELLTDLIREDAYSVGSTQDVKLVISIDPKELDPNSELEALTIKDKLSIGNECFLHHPYKELNDDMQERSIQGGIHIISTLFDKFDYTLDEYKPILDSYINEQFERVNEYDITSSFTDLSLKNEKAFAYTLLTEEFYPSNFKETDEMLAAHLIWVADIYYKIRDDLSYSTMEDAKENLNVYKEDFNKTPNDEIKNEYFGGNATFCKFNEVIRDSPETLLQKLKYAAYVNEVISMDKTDTISSKSMEYIKENHIKKDSKLFHFGSNEKNGKDYVLPLNLLNKEMCLTIANRLKEHRDEIHQLMKVNKKSLDATFDRLYHSRSSQEELAIQQEIYKAHTRNREIQYCQNPLYKPSWSNPSLIKDREDYKALKKLFSNKQSKNDGISL